MKKLFSLLLIAILAFGGGVAFALQEPDDPGIKERSGSTIDVGVKVYQLVRNPNRENNTFGIFNSMDVVWWDVVSDDGVTVNKPSHMAITSSSDAVAGVVAGSIPTSDTATSPSTDRNRGNWGYIQTYGRAIASVDNSNIAVGEGLSGGGYDGAATAANNDHSTSDTETGLQGQLGFAFDASTSSGNAEIFVRTR